MAKHVFECPAEKKADLKRILEENPYEKMSFSFNGYKVKDGAQVGGEDKKAYLFFVAMSDEFYKFAKVKLEGIATEITSPLKDSIIKKIEDEENSAEIGMGAIFG
jgi:hypothetical protein